MDVPLNRREIIATSAVVPLLGTGMLSWANAQENTRNPQSGLVGDIPPEVLALVDLGDSEFPIKATLNRKIEFGSTTYYVVELVQEKSGLGEPIVIKRSAYGDPVILEDFVGLPQMPVPATFDETKDIEIGLFALPDDEAIPDRPPGPAPAQATTVQDTRVFEAAQTNVGLDSSQARGTNGGRLACAWAVNQIVDRALRKPILGGPKGLATANLVKVLRGKHVRIKDPVPGCIVISPTVYVPRANIGHVGIVGEGGMIYSNSSSAAQWQQNFTLATWKSYYVDRKGLSMQFYRLDDIYFPRI